MPYGLKLFLYASIWCISGSAVGFRLLSDSTFVIVFGVALLMAVVAVLLADGRLGGKGCKFPDAFHARDWHQPNTIPEPDE